MSKKLPLPHRSAFTLIEVIISTVIISTVVLSVMEISKRNTDNAVYLSQRNLISFQDSYFLDSKTARYHKDTKNAYDLLSSTFQITEDKSKRALKNISRSITVPEPLSIPSLGDMGPNAQIEKMILKDQYSSSYSRFKISL